MAALGCVCGLLRLIDGGKRPKADPAVGNGGRKALVSAGLLNPRGSICFFIHVISMRPIR